jgi:hypothetical protein
MNAGARIRYASEIVSIRYGEGFTEWRVEGASDASAAAFRHPGSVLVARLALSLEAFRPMRREAFVPAHRMAQAPSEKTCE